MLWNGARYGQKLGTRLVSVVGIRVGVNLHGGAAPLLAGFSPLLLLLLLLMALLMAEEDEDEDCCIIEEDETLLVLRMEDGCCCCCGMLAMAGMAVTVGPGLGAAGAPEK